MLILKGKEKLIQRRKLVMFCPNCGNMITDEMKFCGNCGAKVNSDTISQRKSSKTGNE